MHLEQYGSLTNKLVIISGALEPFARLVMTIIQRCKQLDLKNTVAIHNDMHLVTKKHNWN